VGIARCRPGRLRAEWREWLLIAGALAACDAPEFRPRPEYGLSRALLASTDIAGHAGENVESVTSRTSDPGVVRLVADPVPEIRVGGRNDADLRKELWVVFDAVLRADGKLVAIRDAGREITVFDARGEFLRTLGRQGRGPGEFDRAIQVAITRDETLAIIDAGQIIVYDSAFRFLFNVDVSRNVQCCFGDGGLIAPVPEAIRAAAQQRYWPEGRPQVTWGRMAGLEPNATLTPFLKLEDGDATQTAFWVDGGRKLMTTPVVPFARRAFVRVTPDAIVHSTGDDVGYRIYSSAGILQRVVRVDTMPPLVGRDDRASLRNRWMSRATSRRDTLLYEQALEKLPIPATLPAIDALLTDESGNVWLKTHQRRTAPAAAEYERVGGVDETWLQFGRDGRLAGVLHIPDWHEVIRFTRGRVVLRHVEQVDGFTFVSVHKLLPAPR
jgi:hypothetical protein